MQIIHESTSVEEPKKAENESLTGTYTVREKCGADLLNPSITLAKHHPVAKHLP